MINRIIPLLNKYIPTALAFKGIQKINPKLQKFASGAIAAGYTTDQVVDYLRNRMSGERDEDFGQRPEEQASKAQVQNSKQLPQALQAGASLAGGALGGLAGLASMGIDGQQNQSIQPDEIQQMPNQQPQRQLPYNQQRLIGETPRNPVPQEGEVITPPITPMQQQQAQRQGALSKFQNHKKKQSMADELYNQYQQGYGNKKNQGVDQAILESLAKILEM